jgi:hypothetical protein
MDCDNWKTDYDSTRAALLIAWKRIDELLAVKISFDTQALMMQRNNALDEIQRLKKEIKEFKDK